MPKIVFLSVSRSPQAKSEYINTCEQAMENLFTLIAATGQHDIYWSAHFLQECSENFDDKPYEAIIRKQ